VIVAHPDDVESHCAGTVARLTSIGSQTTLVVVTSGDKGASELGASPADVAAQREAEQAVAAELLGIEEVVFLRWRDGELDDLPRLRREITRQVRGHRPDLVITHDAEHPWPPYTAHRDHRAVGRATLEALYPDARDALYYPEQLAEGLAPHETLEAWLIMSQIPDLFVDISATMSVKIAARLAHVSQYRDAAELEQRFRARDADLGATYGAAYAEAFKRVRFA